MSAHPLRLALGLLWLTAITLAAIEAVLFAAVRGQPWQVYLFTAAAVIYVSAGVLAWERRPSNRMGALLYLSGIVVVAAGLQNTSARLLVAVGLILGVAPIATVFHALLAFPSGRLAGRGPLALVSLGYVITIVLQSPQYLLVKAPPPMDVLEVASRHGLADALGKVQDASGAIVLGVGALVLLLRLYRAARAQRRILGPLYLYGVATILFLEIAVNILPPLFGTSPLTVFALQMSALAGVPIAFVFAVLRGGFARSGEIEELGVWLGSAEGGRPGLRDALAGTLGDPSLELLFWLPDQGYVAADGRAAELPTVGSARAAVEVALAGNRIGAISYDAELIAEPELVRTAGRVIAIALERERLTAQLLASRDELRESRARLVEAGDRERRRIARDLHDGVQGRLVTLAIRAGTLAADPGAKPVQSELTSFRVELEHAGAELRSLVQGVMPALLVERGLYAATEDLVDRLPLPTRLELPATEAALPDAIESTGYFVVAEAVTNAVKHSQARELAVTLARDNGCLRIEVADDGVGGARVSAGSGLRGIADRLDVVGGTLRVESPPGDGTRLTALVPCA